MSVHNKNNYINKITNELITKISPSGELFNWFSTRLCDEDKENIKNYILKVYEKAYSIGLKDGRK